MPDTQGKTIVTRAPGRVNLIGEFTDYNDGFVLPVALRLETRVLASPREERSVHVRSQAFDATVTLDLDNLTHGHTAHWSDAARGILVELQAAGYRLSGCDLTIDGNIPIGAGLSSSASLEIAVGLAVLTLAEATIDRVQLAKIAQRAEHEHGGTKCGIMDQYICALAREGYAMLLDTRTLEFRDVTLPRNAEFIIVNSMVRHELADGAYDQRRRECEDATSRLSKRFPNVRALRDVLPEQLESVREDFRGTPDSEILYRRARHVVTENARTLDGAKALDLGNLAAFGSAMNASHASLRDDFEVSCSELDTLVELAQGFNGVYGARMTGGGFGGSTVNLVTADACDAFCAAIKRSYAQRTGIDPAIYRGLGAPGASVEAGATVEI